MEPRDAPASPQTPRERGEGVTGVSVLTWQLGSVVARLGLGSQQWPLSEPIAEGPASREAGGKCREARAVVGASFRPGLLERNSRQTPPPTPARPEGGLQFSPASTLC